MDLSKKFDTLNHDLLLVNLEAYGLSIDSLRYTWSYVNQRLQRTGENNSFSLWKYNIAGVPKGSILGPLLFNVSICEWLISFHSCRVSRKLYRQHYSLFNTKQY